MERYHVISRQPDATWAGDSTQEGYFSLVSDMVNNHAADIEAGVIGIEHFEEMFDVSITRSEET